MVPNHATSMAELERRIEQCIDDGYNMVFCLIDMYNKKDGRNRDNYLKLKTKYHQKTITRKRQVTESIIRFFESEHCLDICFLYHFKYTTQQFNSSDELAKEMECVCKYEKTEDFLGRKCKGLHNFLLANGGHFERAVANAEKSMLSKNRESREYTYSEMVDFFHEVMRK